MSKFSKRAKFLLILTTVSAVNKISATTLPDECVPAIKSSDATLLLGPDIIKAQIYDRANFKSKNRFSIEPKSALIGGGIVGLAALSAGIINYLFSNKENEKCLDFFIEILKFNKICKFKIEVKNDEIQIEFYGSDPKNSIPFEELLNYQQILDTKEKQSFMNFLGINGMEYPDTAEEYKTHMRDQGILREARRKLNIGLSIFKQSLADYFYAFDSEKTFTSFSMDKDGNFLINDKSIENYKNGMEEQKEKSKNNIKSLRQQCEDYMSNGTSKDIAENAIDFEKVKNESDIANVEKERQIVLKICDNKVIKEVLTAAHKDGVHSKVSHEK